MILHLSDDEMFALHEHLESICRHGGDEPLVHLRDKLRDRINRLRCRRCLKAKQYAQGRCEPCYRYWRRNGEERPLKLIAS